MKIAIYSDIHDNIPHLESLLLELRSREIRTALCLGDFVSPGSVKKIIASGIKTYAVWGNNDGEKVIITSLALQSNGQFNIGETTFRSLEIDSKRVFMTHHPDFATSLAKSGDFDAVFYGHTHKIEQSKLENGCILANPGEIYGQLTNICTFMIWDTETHALEIVGIPL